MDYTANLKVLQKILDSGEILWPGEAQKQAQAEGNSRAVNHGIWNRAIAQFEQIPLWPEGQVPGWNPEEDQPAPSLIFFPAEQAKGTVLISHGGAFVMRAGHEGFWTAKRFHDLGFHTAVLTYRLAPYTRMDALQDIQRAVRTLRARKEELGISDRIAVMGFSAGGMLSANLATHWDLGDPTATDPIERFSCRPDAAVICYGAFAGSSFPGPMLRENPFDEAGRRERVYLAAEKNITVDTPPFFIWQTISDDPRHGISLAKELTDCGVPFELHCFEDGHHGVGLADGHNDSGESFPHLARWSELASEWLHMHNL